MNTLTIAITIIAWAAGTVAVVGTVEDICIVIGGVGGLAVGNQNENGLTDNGYLTLLLTLAKRGGVGCVITDVAENLAAQGDTCLGIRTNTLANTSTSTGIGNAAVVLQAATAFNHPYTALLWKTIATSSERMRCCSFESVRYWETRVFSISVR